MRPSTIDRQWLRFDGNRPVLGQSKFAPNMLQHKAMRAESGTCGICQLLIRWSWVRAPPAPGAARRRSRPWSCRAESSSCSSSAYGDCSGSTRPVDRRLEPVYIVGGHAKYVAGRIPHARLVEFDGDDHEWFAGDSDRVLYEVSSFLTGGLRARPTNRVLSTVLFTDIVGSTARATALGDEAWTPILAAHDRAVGGQAVGAA
jgi:hypothetical protein